MKNTSLATDLRRKLCDDLMDCAERNYHLHSAVNLSPADFLLSLSISLVAITSLFIKEHTNPGHEAEVFKAFTRCIVSTFTNLCDNNTLKTTTQPDK